LVSGTAVISAKVESDLSAVGIQAVRIGGYDRYETAVNIAKEIQTIKPFQEVVVTNAYANVDAISIAPIAAAKGIPVLLVNKDSVPTVVSDFIKSSGINKTYVIGGTAVVSDSVKDTLPNAARLGGYDRFDTNTEVLKKFENLIIGGSMFFANGNDTSLIDSLTGAPMAAKLGGAIVLSNKETVPDGTKGYIQTNIALKNPVVLGGTAVISDSAIQSLGYAQPGQSDILDGAVELSTPNATFRDKTVNGNLLVNAEGVTLQNIRIKGTLFLDPGKDGSATLDDVQATRIVVLSGADRSIYLKETKADSLVVSSSSDVHVVAETGTILGSTLIQSTAAVESKSGANVGSLVAQPQREASINVQLQGTFSNDVSLSGSVKLTAADGAVVPTVTVTGATTPDLIQLAGNFPSVTIDDNSSITVLSGKIDKLETKGTSEIVVKSGAEVTVLSSATGSTKVSGGGTVNGKTTTDTPTEPGDIPVVSDGSGTSRDTDREVIQKTEQPLVTGTVRAGDTMISGTAEAGATVSVKRSGTEIGAATTDGNTGDYTVTLIDGVILAKDEVLSITAVAPGKTESNVSSITVVEAQTTQPTVMGTVSAGETMILGTAEAGATVSVRKSEIEIGTATADETTGTYMVTLNDGVTLAEADVLSITAIAPDKSESDATSVTVAAALDPTTPPTITGMVRAGDTMISGTTDAEAKVCVMRGETVIGTATADETGAYTVTLNAGVILAKDEVLSIIAKAPDKAISEAVSVTVVEAQTTQPTVMGTFGTGETMILGTAEAGATVSVKRSEIEIGTATADETTGTYMVTLSDGVTLAEADVLSITATAPDKTESNATIVTVAAALDPTTAPAVMEMVRAGETVISGTTDAEALVCVMRDGTVIGTATADEIGAYTVTLNDGVILAKDEVLSVIAKAPEKAMSEVVSVTVVDAQTSQPTVMGTVGAGETMIIGTAEAGATVSVKRSESEIGTATADETTGTYMVTLSDGVTLAEADVLSITATAPDKTESNATSVTVAAALVRTTQPTVMEMVRAGETMISGTTDAESFVCVMRDGTVIGTAIADETGTYTVTLNDGVTLAEGDEFSIIAKAPDKAMSEAVSVTVVEAEVTPEAVEAEVTPEAVEAEVTPEAVEAEVTPEAVEAEVTPEVVEAEVTPEVVEAEVTPEVVEAEVTPKVVEAEVTPEVEAEVTPEAAEAEATPETPEAQ